MPEWADVYVRDDDERANLNIRALFFIPSARPTLADLDITAAALAGHAGNADDPNGVDIKIGLAAITTIMNCNPTSYISARKFVAAANSLLTKRGATHRFAKTDIVACVFRFKDFPNTLKSCNLTFDQVATACEIKPEIIRSLMNPSYRVSLSHALKIRSYLCDYAEANNTKLNNFETIDGCITAFSRPGDAVALMKEPTKEKEKDRYFYKRSDLTAAPAEGHPWAVSP